MNITKNIELKEQSNNKILDLLIKIPENIGTPISLLLHTIIFASFLALPLFGYDSERVNIFFTTLLSLEAIYLAIFIQMSVNRSNQNIQDLSEDLDDIQEDIEDIQGDIDYMTEEDELINSNPSNHVTMSQQIELLQKQIHTMSAMIDKMKDEVKK
jgi:peptidoglycan hydrolase CwlO-like protein